MVCYKNKKTYASLNNFFLLNKWSRKGNVENIFLVHIFGNTYYDAKLSLSVMD
jgi:hypothetical protein